MAMTYDSLVGSKDTPGSIIKWSNYTKLDVNTVVDEAQSLIYGVLRVREMRTEWTFGMAVGQSEIALPSRFLDPIGRMFDISNSNYLSHKIETDIQSYRAYDNSLAGSLPTNPFTTTTGSTSVRVASPSHTLTQGSAFTILGATTVDAFNLNGTWPITSIVDADNFYIGTDTTALTSITGGGASVTYTANKLISGSPMIWTIWDEAVKFDLAFQTATLFKQLYYRAPALLSSTNQSNWLVNRYPNLMRIACLAASAAYMKADSEYQKQYQSLVALVQSIAAENDLGYRGASFGTDTP